MKTIVATALLVVLLQFGAEARPTSNPEKCIQELNIDPEKVDSLFKGTLYLPEDDPEISAFLSCVWKRGGYQEQNGEINFPKVIQLTKDFPRKRFGANSTENVGLELASEAAEHCKDVPKGNSDGQTVAKVQNCMTKYIVGVLVKDN